MARGLTARLAAVMALAGLGDLAPPALGGTEWASVDGTEWASVDDGAGGEALGTHSSEAAISGDGRLVAFSSDAANLVAGDTNGADDVFVRDRAS